MTGDLHVHMFLDGENYKAAVQRHRERPCEAWIRCCLEAYRGRGITFLRDGGDYLGVSLRARALAAEYGIDYRSPAFPIHKKGHYGAIVGRAYADRGEYLALLREARAQGADFIKLMLSGLIDFSKAQTLTEPPLEAEEIRFLVEAAHDMGFAVMTHANGDAAVLPAVAAGAESVEHGAFLSGESLFAMAEHKTLWVPTLVTVGNLMGCGRFPDGVLLPLLQTQLEKLAYAAKAGVLIGLGSDAGAYRVFHGRGAQQELALLRQALGEQAEARLQAAEQFVKDRFRYQ